MYNFEFVHPLKRLAILRSIEINHKNVENCRSLFKKKQLEASWMQELSTRNFALLNKWSPLPAEEYELRQAAYTPGQTDAKCARCWIQLPRPWAQFIKE